MFYIQSPRTGKGPDGIFKTTRDTNDSSSLGLRVKQISDGTLDSMHGPDGRARTQPSGRPVTGSDGRIESPGNVVAHHAGFAVLFAHQSHSDALGKKEAGSTESHGEFQK